MRRYGSVLCVGVAAAMVWAAVAVRRTSAQDEPPAVGGPARVVGRVMQLIGNGQIDDAVGQMDGVKDNATEKDAVRGALIEVRDKPLGTYRGCDVSAVVRYSARLQTLDVLGYFDQQPVLYRFQYYQPSDNAAWQVLDLRVDANLTTAMETLRDDAAGAALGKGGRATR